MIIAREDIYVWKDDIPEAMREELSIIGFQSESALPDISSPQGKDINRKWLGYCLEGDEAFTFVADCTDYPLRIIRNFITTGTEDNTDKEFDIQKEAIEEFTDNLSSQFRLDGWHFRSFGGGIDKASIQKQLKEL